MADTEQLEDDKHMFITKYMKTRNLAQKETGAKIFTYRGGKISGAAMEDFTLQAAKVIEPARVAVEQT
eukprot:13282984-Heterocapsa_arctica.AAC.1